MFPDSHEVGKHLTGVAEVCKSVDYRDIAVFCEVLDLLLLECTYHYTAEVAGENSCCILYRLATAYLEVVRREEERVSAELIHTCLERNSCTCRSLLEYHSEGLSLEVRMRDIVLELILELVSKVEYLSYFFCAQVEHFE